MVVVDPFSAVEAKIPALVTADKDRAHKTSIFADSDDSDDDGDMFKTKLSSRYDKKVLAPSLSSLRPQSAPADAKSSTLEQKGKAEERDKPGSSSMDSLAGLPPPVNVSNVATKTAAAPSSASSSSISSQHAHLKKNSFDDSLDEDVLDLSGIVRNPNEDDDANNLDSSYNRSSPLPVLTYPDLTSLPISAKSFPKLSSRPFGGSLGEKKKIENSPVSSPRPMNQKSMATTPESIAPLSSLEQQSKGKVNHSSGSHSSGDAAGDTSTRGPPTQPLPVPTTFGMDTSSLPASHRLNAAKQSASPNASQAQSTKRASNHRISFGFAEKEEEPLASSSDHLGNHSLKEFPTLRPQPHIEEKKTERVDIREGLKENTADIAKAKVKLSQAIHEREAADKLRMLELEELQSRLEKAAKEGVGGGGGLGVAPKSEVQLRGAIVQETLSSLHDHLEHQRVVTQLELEIIRLKDDANLKALKYQEDLKYYKERFEVEAQQMKGKFESDVESIEKRHADRWRFSFSSSFSSFFSSSSTISFHLSFSPTPSTPPPSSSFLNTSTASLH